ncbi:MAG: hypothetical protein ABWY56_08655 [Propionibacteriaceae bacterium]
MFSLWTLLVSLAVFGISIAAAVVSVRAGEAIAIVLSFDASAIALIGIAVGSALYGSFQLPDVLLFVAVPLLLVIAALRLAGHRETPTADPGAWRAEGPRLDRNLAL